MEDHGPLLSIGEMARRAGLPVRTIRFWSDAGVLPPAGRTESGRRLYDAACAARLEPAATLRELGLGLADVRLVLDGQASIAEVAAVHLDALDAQIRALRLHRSVLAVVVKRAAGNEEMPMMSKLARMSVAERRQMIDDFMAEVIEGWDPSQNFAPRWSAAPNLPDDPSPEQVDAWVELAEMVSDRDFRQRVRQVVDYGRPRDADERLRDQGNWVTENAMSAALREYPAGFRRGGPGSEPDPGVPRGACAARNCSPGLSWSPTAGSTGTRSSRPSSTDGRRSRPTRARWNG